MHVYVIALIKQEILSSGETISEIVDIKVFDSAIKRDKFCSTIDNLLEKGYDYKIVETNVE